MGKLCGKIVADRHIVCPSNYAQNVSIRNCVDLRVTWPQKQRFRLVIQSNLLYSTFYVFANIRDLTEQLLDTPNFKKWNFWHLFCCPWRKDQENINKSCGNVKSVDIFDGKIDSLYRGLGKSEIRWKGPDNCSGFSNPPVTVLQFFILISPKKTLTAQPPAECLSCESTFVNGSFDGDGEGIINTDFFQQDFYQRVNYLEKLENLENFSLFHWWICRN